MLTATIQNVLNRGLPRSPRARELCSELSGRRIAVEVRGIAEFTITSDGNAIQVSSGGPGSAGASRSAGPPGSAGAPAAAGNTGGAGGTEGSGGVEARVRAGLTTLLRFSAPEPPASLRAAGAEIEGDEALAERYRELAMLLRPDLEEELALAIGDVPAHQIARVAKAAFGWFRSAADTTVRNFAEYFAHERGDLVSRAEGRQLLEGVEEACARIDRIEARIARLERRVAAGRRESRAP